MRVAWVTNYMEDLEADFRVFYRIDDLNDIDGPTFFRLAMRVGAYQGVIAARMAKEREDESPAQRPQPSQQHAPQQRQDNETKYIQATPAELSMAAPGMFGFSTVKKVD